MERKSKISRVLFLSAAVWVCFAVSGCYYARLAKVKSQLGRFDEYVELRNQQRLFVIDMQKPVLLEKDVIKLMEAEPTQIHKINGRGAFDYVLEKVYPEGKTETGDYNILIRYIFDDGKMSEIHVDQRLFAAIPKDIAVGILKGMGKAKINMFTKSASVTADLEKLNLPGADEIAVLLGRPFAVDGSSVEYSYNCSYCKNEEIRILRLTFDKQGRVLKIKQNLLSGGKPQMLEFTDYWKQMDENKLKEEKNGNEN